MLNSEKVRVLWQADGEGGGAPSLGGFADEDADMTEIVTLKPGEEPPSEEDEDDGKVTLSRDEYEALKQGKDSTSVLANSMKELKEVLSGQGEPANVQQKPGESDEDFEKRLEQELFADGQSAKAIKEAVQRYGGMGQVMSYISQQNKRLLKLDEESGPIFKRYESEIENVVNKLPPDQQNHPQVWEYALGQVKERHKDELQSESVEQMVQRRVQEELEKLGVSGQQEGTKGKKSAPFVESGSGSANRGGRKKKTVYVTETDKRNARESGLPLEHYLRKIGKA